MAAAATRRRPRGRTLAGLVTSLALLTSARPTLAQDANATNATNATASVNVTMAPPPQPSPPPLEAAVAPPPPPARPSMDELKAAATRRVLDIPRFVKTEDACPEALLAPPSAVAAADRRFLLPPGRTWGPLSFELASVADEDFTRDDVPEPERFLEELVLDFALVAAPDASNRTSADVRLMVPVRDLSEGGTGATEPGDTVAETARAVAAKSYVRVLPARSDVPNEVDATTTPYLAIDRLLAAFEDDAVVTPADAASVAAVLTPDAPGTYVVLITAVDACNATSHAFANVTALCARAPRPAVARASAGASRWDRRAAAAHADDTHPLGWWAPRVLDGSGTVAVDATEGNYHAHKAWVDSEIWAGDVAAADSPNATEAWDAATPLRTSPFSSWIWWSAAPRWTANANEADGFLYRWTMTSAPRGSNAWRRVLGERDATSTVDPTAFSTTESGARVVHASALATGETPFVDDAATATATFTPDVVGTYAFRLDVSNVCHAASVAFEASFECNAEPRWVESEIRASSDARGCLARQTVSARVQDDDGDDVFVTWSHLRGREGWPEARAAPSFGAEEETSADGDGDAGTVTEPEVAADAAANGADAAFAVNGTTTATNADATDVFAADATFASPSSVEVAAAAPATTSAGELETVAARTFSDGVTFTGARSASGGAVLSSYVGNLTSFQPDVPGTYALLATLTDGCTATSAEVFVEVAWSEECDSLAAAAAETSTVVTVFLFASAVALVMFASRHVPTHPLDPRATRDVAVRLREWELRKAAVKRARLRERWEAEQDAAGEAAALAAPGAEASQSGSRLMDEAERERVAAARRRRRAARARARVARRFAAAVAACAGAREEGSRLVPATTHLWRLACFVGVFAEGVSLCSLAFAVNTAPWWGRTVASVGRALAFQLDAPGLYAAHEALAACVAVAAAAALLHAAYFSRAGGAGGAAKPSDGDRALARRGVVVRSAWKRPPRPRFRDAGARGGDDELGSFAHDEESRERASRAFATSDSRFALDALAATTPFLIWLVAEPLLVPVVASSAATVTCTHGDATAPFPHLTRDADAPCYGTQAATNRALGAVVVAGVVAPVVGAYFATRVAPRLDPLAVEQPWFALVRLACKWFLAAFCVVTGEGDMTRVEPRGAEYGAPSGAHRGYPADAHAARDDAHLAALAAGAAFLYALNFRAAPVRGAGTSRRVNAARGACLACAFWVAALACFVLRLTDENGAASAARETGVGAAALLLLPFFFRAGWRHTAARASLFAYPDLSPAEMRRAPDPRVRAMGVLAGDASDGLCGAFGNWEGLRAHRAASAARKRARGVDSSAASEALGVDRTPGVGLIGLTDEGRRDAADDALVWQIVMQTYFAGGGSGRYALRATREDGDADENGSASRDQTVSRGARAFSFSSGAADVSSTTFTVDPSVRAHFCDAVSALASSPRGVATAQKYCLVPLLRRVLLDDSPANAAVRARAAEATRALARSRRGAALLCLGDDDSFMTMWYHRQRDWFRVLVHLEARYGRAAADLARVSYLLGFGAARADAATRLERDRFDALCDWNVRRWLDDGACGLGTSEGGGDDDDGRGFGDKERMSVFASAKRACVAFSLSLLGTAAPEARDRLRRGRRARAAARLALIRVKRHARGDISTSECLARTLRDANAETAVVVAAIRAAGDWLASLRAARGAADPRCAERRLRDAARRDAGSLFRAGGILWDRDVFESWTTVDDDDFLAQTVPGARVMVQKSEILAKRRAEAEAEEKRRFFEFESFADFKEKLAESVGGFARRFSATARAASEKVLEKVFGIVARAKDRDDESDSENDELAEEDSDGAVSVSADADSDADRDASVTEFEVFAETRSGSGSGSRANGGDGLAAFRVYGDRGLGDVISARGLRVRPSPMDKALDEARGEEAPGAPGLLESLVACTAHGVAHVRTAAHEELRRAAAGDDAATVVRRALAYTVSVDTNVDSTGRVRALEWLNSLVASRYRVLADAAAAVAAAREREARDAEARFPRFPSGGASVTEDYARIYPGLAATRELSRAVDLSLAVGVAEDATPCVAAALSLAGVVTVARCLEDRESPAVRVAAIHALRDAWETLAAESSAAASATGAPVRDETETGATTPTETGAFSDGVFPSSDATEKRFFSEGVAGWNASADPTELSTRARRFLAAGAFAKLRGSAESDPDAGVRRAADAFLTRVAQTEGAAVLAPGAGRVFANADARDAFSDAPFFERVPADADAFSADEADADAETSGIDEDEDEDEDEDASVSASGADEFATTTGYETSGETDGRLETSSRRGGAAPSRSGSGSEPSSEPSSESECGSAATSASSWRFGRVGEEDRFARGEEEGATEAGGAFFARDSRAVRGRDGPTGREQEGSRYRAGGAGAMRWDAYVRENAPPTVRYARSKPTAERNARRPLPPADVSGRAAGDLSRWSTFVAREPAPAVVARARRGFVAGDDAGDARAALSISSEDPPRAADPSPRRDGIGNEAEAVEEGEAARERRERRARGARQVRARVPLRAAPVAGAVLAPTRAGSGDPAGPGPAAPVVRDLDRPLAPVDPNRPTWRERAAEYILAGGGAGGAGGARRGPHERALLRDGRVGLAGRRRENRRGGGGGVGAAPHDLFPDEGTVRDRGRIGSGASSVVSFDAHGGTGAARYRARSRYGGGGGGSDVSRDKRRGLRDADPGAGPLRQDSRLHDFDGFDFDALDAARAAAASEYAETDDGGDGSRSRDDA